MLSRLQNLLKIENSEIKIVSLFFLLSFLLGIFHISIEISATTLFLSFFDDNMLSKALLISGILGFSLSFCYSKFQNRFLFDRFVEVVFLSMIVLLITLRIFVVVIQSDILAFVLFILMGPLTIISVISYWGIAGRAFSLRQGKRLYGLIYSGQLFGVILLSFSTTIVLKLLGNVENLIFVGSASLLVSIFVLQTISKKIGNSINELSVNTANENVEVKYLLHDRYVMLMAVFVVLSVVVAFFIYYIFLSVTKVKYPQSIDLASFLGLFIATTNIFSFVVRTFVHRYLLQTFGLRMILLLCPIVLGVFAIMLSIVGTIYGKTPESSQYIFFFIIVALSRMLYLILRESIQQPTFEFIYQSVAQKIRFKVQAFIDGMVNESATIGTSLLLVGLSFIEWFDLIYYSYFLIFIICFWIIFAIKLYQNYRKSLQNSLQQIKNSQITNVEQKNIDEILKNVIANSKNNDSIVALKILEQINFEEYKKQIYNVLSVENVWFHRYIIQKIHIDKILYLIQFLKEKVEAESNETLKNEINQTIKDFELQMFFQSDVSRLADLTASAQKLDRLLATKLLMVNCTSENLHYLIVLLKDINPIVRINAIKTASLIADKRLIPALMENFLSAEYSSFAMKAFVQIGQPALQILEQTFYKSGIKQADRIRILQVISKIDCPESKKLFLEKLSFQNREIVALVIQQMIEHNWTSLEANRVQLLNLVYQYSSTIVWNLSALSAIFDYYPTTKLEAAISVELTESYNALYQILALIYGSEQINYIRNNIKSREAEKINYSIELLELIVDEPIKPYLLILFEDISIKEKLFRLNDYFTINKYSQQSILQNILNRSCNYIGAYSKICAMLLIPRYFTQIPDALVAQLFNNDIALSEVAAQVMQKMNPDFFKSCLSRLSQKSKNRINEMFENQSSVISRYLYLSQLSYFSDIPSKCLFKFAELSQQKKYFVDDVIASSDEHLLLPTIILLSGKVVLQVENNILAEYSENDIIDDFNIDETQSYVLCVKEPTIAIVVSRNERNLLIDANKQLVKVFLNYE